MYREGEFQTWKMGTGIVKPIFRIFGVWIEAGGYLDGRT
jgi:hypothetical protein